MPRAATVLAAARVASGGRNTDRLPSRCQSPDTAPAVAYVSAATPRVAAAGGMRSTTQPAPSPTRAPLVGPPSKPAATTTSRTRSGPREPVSYTHLRAHE